MQPCYFQGIRLSTPFVRDCNSIRLKTVSVLCEGAATISPHLPRLQAFPVVFPKPFIRTLINHFQGFFHFSYIFIFFLSYHIKSPQKLHDVTIIKNKLFALTTDSLQPTLVWEELEEASPNLIHGVSTDLNTQRCGAQTLRYFFEKPAAKHRKPLINNNIVFKSCLFLS